MRAQVHTTAPLGDLVVAAFDKPAAAVLDQIQRSGLRGRGGPSIRAEVAGATLDAMLGDVLRDRLRRHTKGDRGAERRGSR